MSIEGDPENMTKNKMKYIEKKKNNQNKPRNEDELMVFSITRWVCGHLKSWVEKEDIFLNVISRRVSSISPKSYLCPQPPHLHLSSYKHISMYHLITIIIYNFKPHFG